MASVAALAALDPQPTPDGAALEVALASGAASLAALDLQLTPDGAAPVASVIGKRRLAPYWAALVTSVPLGY